MMIPKFRIILEQAIEEGVRRGYNRAYKHTTDPSDNQVIDAIESAVISSLYEYFTFTDNNND